MTDRLARIDSPAQASGLAVPAAPPSARPVAIPVPRALDFAYAQRRAFVLALTIASALFFRSVALGSYGFSDDEINKLQAVRAYGHLDVTSNAEHPMLMKALMLGSIDAARGWNAVAARAGLPAVSQEAALRFPNALAGALTTLVVFLLAEALVGLRVAAWAAFFWAFDVNAIAINRIGKEDTLLVFFLFAAAWLYQRGKQVGLGDPGRAQRWYRRSGAAFGLMVASKYMPHFYGIHAIYAGTIRDGSVANRPRKVTFYLAMISAFLLANVPLVLPATWRYLVSYAQGDTVRHSGYYFAHHLYPNLPSMTPFGLPPWFYLAFLGAKVPIPILAAFGLGIAQMIRRRHEDGFAFLRVFAVFFLLPYSLVATKFVRYLLPFLVVLDIVAAVGVVWLLNRVRDTAWPPSLAALGGLAAMAIFSWAPVAAVVSAAPDYSLYQNGVGARLGPPGWMFPDDEFYDAGLREAARYVAAHALPGAVVSSDAPGVVREYLDQAGRADVAAWSLSQRGAPVRAADGWVLAQDGHTYFETEALLRTLRLHPPEQQIFVHGVVAVQIFRTRR